MNGDTVLDQFGVHDRREFWVEGGEDFGAALQLGHLDASAGEAFCHLEPDIPGADDDRGARVTFGEVGSSAKVSPIEWMTCTPSSGPACRDLDAGEGGKRAGADDQLVVVDDGFAVSVLHGELLAGDIDSGGEGVQPQPHARRFEVGVGAVGERLPGRDITREVVRDAADGVVRVAVRDHDGDVDAGVEFSGAQRGGDARVAAADGDDVHDRFLGGLGLSLSRVTRALPERW